MKAALVARATDRQCSSISSSKTSLVSSIPKATMARLSPTRMRSIPAASATWALGKSWAVIIVIGSRFLCISRSLGRVTFFLGLAGGVPMGECELHLDWVCCVAETIDRKGDKASCGGRVRLDNDLATKERYMGTCVPASVLRSGAAGVRCREKRQKKVETIVAERLRSLALAREEKRKRLGPACRGGVSRLLFTRS